MKKYLFILLYAISTLHAQDKFDFEKFLKDIVEEVEREEKEEQEKQAAVFGHAVKPTEKASGTAQAQEVARTKETLKSHIATLQTELNILQKYVQTLPQATKNQLTRYLRPPAAPASAPASTPKKGERPKPTYSGVHGLNELLALISSKKLYLKQLPEKEAVEITKSVAPIISSLSMITKGLAPAVFMEEDEILAESRKPLAQRSVRYKQWRTAQERRTIVGNTIERFYQQDVPKLNDQLSKLVTSKEVGKAIQKKIKKRETIAKKALKRQPTPSSSLFRSPSSRQSYRPYGYNPPSHGRSWSNSPWAKPSAPAKVPEKTKSTKPTEKDDGISYGPGRKRKDDGKTVEAEKAKKKAQREKDAAARKALQGSPQEWIVQTVEILNAIGEKASAIKNPLFVEDTAALLQGNDLQTLENLIKHIEKANAGGNAQYLDALKRNLPSLVILAKYPMVEQGINEENGLYYLTPPLSNPAPEQKALRSVLALVGKRHKALASVIQQIAAQANAQALEIIKIAVNTINQAGEPIVAAGSPITLRVILQSQELQKQFKASMDAITSLLNATLIAQSNPIPAEQPDLAANNTAIAQTERRANAAFSQNLQHKLHILYTFSEENPLENSEQEEMMQAVLSGLYNISIILNRIVVTCDAIRTSCPAIMPPKLKGLADLTVVDALYGTLPNEGQFKDSWFSEPISSPEEFKKQRDIVFSLDVVKDYLEHLRLKTGSLILVAQDGEPAKSQTIQIPEELKATAKNGFLWMQYAGPENLHTDIYVVQKGSLDISTPIATKSRPLTENEVEQYTQKQEIEDISEIVGKKKKSKLRTAGKVAVLGGAAGIGITAVALAAAAVITAAVIAGVSIYKKMSDENKEKIRKAVLSIPNFIARQTPNPVKEKVKKAPKNVAKTAKKMWDKLPDTGITSKITGAAKGIGRWLGFFGGDK